MSELANLIAYVLSAAGLTILIIWPQTGPGAWIRERVLRRLLRGSAAKVLDCYICFSFWCGLLLSPVSWRLVGHPWSWAGCFMTPAVFWLVLRDDASAGE